MKITTAMQNNARRGIALSKKYKQESVQKCSKEALKPADDIIFGRDSVDLAKSLYAFFYKAAEKYDPRKKDADGSTSVAGIDWLLHGGSAGYSWARLVLKQANILKSYKAEITSEELNKEDSNELSSLSVKKSVDEELMQATFISLMPDEVDLHGDIYDAREVRKACENFNKYCNKANLMHLVDTESFSIIESYISPVDFILNDVEVKKGTWLVTLQFHNEDIWKGVKEGYFNGVSIGAKAFVENLED